MELEGESARLGKRPVTFMRLTGLSVERFEALLKEVAPLLSAANVKRLSGRERKRGIGAGRRYDLPVCDRLLMTLMYYRTYVSQEFLGYLFDMDSGNVCRNMKIVRPVLAQVFRVPERRIKMMPEDVATLFFDGTEQRINRPQGRVEQRKFYSGKKKAHMMKNQVAVYRRPQDGRPFIAAVSPSREGKTHDKKMYSETRTTTPPGVKRAGDTGYQGTTLEIPHKKPKGGSLTPEQKESNRAFSSKRVKVEHGIGTMKRFGIASQRWRNPRRTRTIIIKNVAGLANWAAA